MPHKHKRKKGISNSSYELPPSQKAQSLPARKSTNSKNSKPRNGNQSEWGADDTPKSFARLMVFAKTGKSIASGFDGGDKLGGRKRKRDQEQDHQIHKNQKSKVQDGPVENASKPILQIQPGEKLSQFSARVDQALPLGGLNTKGKKVEGVKDKITKHSKRLKKMQSDWREEDALVKSRKEEELEEAEEQWDEQLDNLDKESRDLMIKFQRNQGKKNKISRDKALGEVDDGEDDPWAVLNHKRTAPQGIFDVVQAPPKFDKKPRHLLKDSVIQNVPKNAGSLKRREDLGQTRANIIKSYRDMMITKRQ